MTTKLEYSLQVLTEMTIKELLDAYRHTDDVLLMANIQKEVETRCSIEP